MNDGKFQITIRAPRSPYGRLYWMQPAKNWTMNGQEATFFASKSDAENEAPYAKDYRPAEAVGGIELRQTTD